MSENGRLRLAFYCMVRREADWPTTECTLVSLHQAKFVKAFRDVCVLVPWAHLMQGLNSRSTRKIAELMWQVIAAGFNGLISGQCLEFLAYFIVCLFLF